MGKVEININARLGLGISLSLVLFGYFTWEWQAEAGLYAVLIKLQITHLGSHYPFYTYLLLTAAANHLFIKAIFFGLSPEEREKIRQKNLAKEAEMTEAARLASRHSFQLKTAAVSVIVGLGIFLAAQLIPDGTEAPQTVNLTSLRGEQALELGNVKLINGVVRKRYIASIEIQDGQRTYMRYYAPIVSAGVERSVLRTFQEVTVPKGTPFSIHWFTGEGYLERAPLPLLVRNDYAARGITIANTVYVVRPVTRRSQIGWYITAAMFFGLAFTTLLGTFAPSAIRARRKAIQNELQSQSKTLASH